MYRSAPCFQETFLFNPTYRKLPVRTFASRESPRISFDVSQAVCFKYDLEKRSEWLNILFPLYFSSNNAVSTFVRVHLHSAIQFVPFIRALSSATIDTAEIEVCALHMITLWTRRQLWLIYSGRSSRDPTRPVNIPVRVSPPAMIRMTSICFDKSVT